jgi:hypothetical protein
LICCVKLIGTGVFWVMRSRNEVQVYSLIHSFIISFIM